MRWDEKKNFLLRVRDTIRKEEEARLNFEVAVFGIVVDLLWFEEVFAKCVHKQQVGSDRSTRCSRHATSS